VRYARPKTRQQPVESMHHNRTTPYPPIRQASDARPAVGYPNTNEAATPSAPSASKKVRSLLELVVSALMKPSHTAPLFQAVVSLMYIGHQELTVKRFMLMASNVGTLIPIRVITLLASDLSACLCHDNGKPVNRSATKDLQANDARRAGNGALA